MVSISIDLQIILCVLLLLLTGNLEADPKARCMKKERDALLEFKHGLVDPSNMLESWVGDKCCSWLGITCHNTTGRVTKLELRSHYSLGGEISNSLINLTHLRYLDLSRNNFSQIHIPKFLGSFKMLQYLNLNQSKFIGNVPPDIGNISRLKYLDLSGNSGLIVQSLSFVSDLTCLEFLDLSGLNLSAANEWMNSINTLPSLMELLLYSCSLKSFSGFVPANFTSLAVLDLSGNQLRGHLPHEIGSLKFLEVLRLYQNDFEGELPETLLNSLCNLGELDLSSNSFSGEIGRIFDNSLSGCVSPNLKALDLSNNNFSGVIPDSLGSFTHLESVSLRENFFSGRIPETIGRLSNLTELFLDDNLLNGSIPESIGQLSKLEYLYLDSNKLDGIVSEFHFSTLESLITLSMYRNSLVFDIDSAWVPPFQQLHDVYLESCKLGPKFPEWLRGLTNNSLELLDLYNTSISGGIPDWFQNISANICWLDLSHNQIRNKLPTFGIPSDPVLTRVIYLNSNKFEGPVTMLSEDVELLDISNSMLSGQIPQTISDTMPLLELLSLSNNKLSGGIPSSLCELTGLSYLDLSKNQLSGVIPECLCQLQLLHVLDLAFNKFSGRIPVSLGSLHILRSLHLEGNNLEGNIPTSLGNLIYLFILDLSENALTGSFPSWINASMDSLAVLSLRSNLLKGEIPTRLCGINSLHILNLADNKMTGTIPSCFNNFTSMIVDDQFFAGSLDYIYSLKVLFEFPQSDTGRSTPFQDHVLAYFKGRELEYNKTIQFLFSIDLSENNFSGNIPNEILNLKLVQNLNLSGNKLTGNIPSEIGNMSALESLDFSQNKLSGSIPQSISDLNFLSYLNLSFNNLSGPIPRGNQLQTLDDKSIYMGNGGLCGFPLQRCQKEPQLHDGKPADKDGPDESEMQWFYFGLGAGFMTGFALVCNSLYFKSSWRRRFFRMVDKVYNKLYVTIVVKMNQLKRNFGQT